jgi:hypothetical protein
VFRQVVAIRWKEGVSAQAQDAYRVALEALRGVPQLVHLVWGDDARHFEGNFDLVAVATHVTAVRGSAVPCPVGVP